MIQKGEIHMLKAKDYRERAREALKGKWVQASIAGLIAGVLGSTILYKGYAGSSANVTETEESLAAFSPEIIIAAVLMVVGIAAVMILIGSLPISLLIWFKYSSRLIIFSPHNIMY